MLLMSPWTRGPAADAGGAVVVSLTDFTPHRRRDVPRIVGTGLRLRLGWFAMPGAVGLWLWSQPLAIRSGSISVWATEEDLHRFVRLPAHVSIMRRFREHGDLRSTMWSDVTFAPAEIVDRARRWIA